MPVASPSARATLALLLTLALLAVGCAAPGAPGAPRAPGSSAPKAAEAAPRPAMVFDHPTRSGPPVPLAVYIHGGGWSSGDKLSDPYYGFVKPRLLAQGVAVASIDYRLAPAHRFPAQIVDAAYAVRYLRSNAKALRIDPDRIAAFGTSAGGHLAALLGTADRSAGFDVGPLKGASSRVKAVAVIAAPTDLTDPSIPAITNGAIQPTFGVASGTPGDPTLTKASPSAYVSADDAPFLIVHGTLDELVPYTQAVSFAKQLQAAGVRTEFVPVVGATHALGSPGQSIAPNQIADRIGAFLISELQR